MSYARFMQQLRIGYAIYARFTHRNTHYLRMIYAWVTQDLRMIYAWVTQDLSMSYAWVTQDLLVRRIYAANSCV